MGQPDCRLSTNFTLIHSWSTLFLAMSNKWLIHSVYDGSDWPQRFYSCLWVSHQCPPNSGKLPLHFCLITQLAIVFLFFDPTTWRTSRTTSRWRSTLKVRSTQNSIKDKMIGRVDILWCIFEKIAKKFKNEVTKRKNVVFALFIWKCSKNYFFGSCAFNLDCFAVFFDNL
jgi:hypothetical protein